MTIIDLNRAAAFVRVVEGGSFTAAGKVLAVPTSSVSRAVARLEEELGVRLLHRTTRKLSLTDSGQSFFRRMQAVVGEADEAVRAVGGFASEPRGTVRMTAPNARTRRFPQIIAGIVRRYPGLVIELQLTNRVVDLVAEGIDLAIRAGLLADSSLVARRVAGSSLGLFASPDYLKRHGRPRAPRDLTRHTCLTYGGPQGKLPWRLRGPNGEKTVAVSGPIVCDDMTFLQEAAIAGAGIAILPSEICLEAVEAKELVRVMPRYSAGGSGSGLYLVWPSQKLVPARVVAVREMLIDELSRGGLQGV
jgi:DNA-binding transcriptional LysR family regulator